MHRLALTLTLWSAACLPACGEPPAVRVHIEERVRLGGVPQFIVIRGEDRRNPVLLFLHGGPGISERPFAGANAELERDFLVVQWDQRGSGKSYSADIAPASLRVAQFVSDAEELTRYLLAKFGRRKIYLVGHSWGSMVGLLAAARAPELYHAYIGISQVIDVPRSETALHILGERRARDSGDARRLRELQTIGPPPYRTTEDERRVNKITRELRPPLPNGMNAWRWLGLALTAPDFSVSEIFQLKRGIRFTGENLRRELFATDLAERVSTTRVPAYFLTGRYDTVISPEPLQQWFPGLRAPAGKRIVWFEDSDHWPHLEEPAKYARVLREIKARSGDASSPLRP